MSTPYNTASQTEDPRFSSQKEQCAGACEFAAVLPDFGKLVSMLFGNKRFLWTF